MCLWVIIFTTKMNKSLRYLFGIALWFAPMIASAAIPQGYYTSLNGKMGGATLKTAVYEIINHHTSVSSYSDLPKYFRKTDARPDGEHWWEMYSNQTFYLYSFTGLNREHSVPKSWWGGDSDTQAYTDLNHLYPSEMKANSAKSNYPLGVVDMSQSVKFNNSVSKVGYAVTGQGGGANLVFEPADEYKGDFARTYFYMVTRYQNLNWKYTYMFQNNTYPTLNGWSKDLLLKWHRQDPVSQKEIDRNEQVYLVQNNRNPYIDFPSLAEYVWGDKVGELFYPDNGTVYTPTGTPNLITPTQGMVLDFGEVAIGSSMTQQLFFKGENLTGSTLSLTLSRNDAAMFSLSDKSIKTSLINSADGYWLKITYTPTALGAHTTKLIITDGGLTGSRGIVLKGECLEVPTVSAVKALSASDITDDSYVANWEKSTDDIVDYYVVTRTRYVGGTASAEELIAEDNYLEINGFKDSDSESYSVQAVRLGYRSAMSNVVFVEHAGISGVTTDLPLGVRTMGNMIHFTCGTPHTDGCIYNAAGQLITRLPVIENNMEVTLPSGIYFITTNQMQRPIKIVAN